MAAGTAKGLAAFSTVNRQPPPATAGAPPGLVVTELEASLEGFLKAEADSEWETATLNKQQSNLRVRSRRRPGSAALEFRCDVTLVATATL